MRAFRLAAIVTRSPRACASTSGSGPIRCHSRSTRAAACSARVPLARRHDPTVLLSEGFFHQTLVSVSPGSAWARNTATNVTGPRRPGSMSLFGQGTWARSGTRALRAPTTRSRARPVSGGRLVSDGVDFRQQAGLDVEDEAAHRDVLRDPRMGSHLLDLFPSVLLRVFVREEAHRSR